MKWSIVPVRYYVVMLISVLYWRGLAKSGIGNVRFCTVQ